MVFAIPFDVFAKFGKPIVLIRFRSGGDFAVGMAMPKAAMNENDSPIFWQNNVRFSRKLSVTGSIDRKSVPQVVQEAASNELWFRIPPTYAAHHPGAMQFGNLVWHSIVID